MESSMIDIIYDTVAQTSEYDTERKEYIKLEDDAVTDKILNPTRKENIRKCIEYEDLIFLLASRNEQFGFIQGFKCAMQLMAECNTGIRKIEE